MSQLLIFLNIKFMKIKRYHILTLFLLAGTHLPLLAQAPPPATPIDGGLSALLLAGGLYGINKIRRIKR